VRTTTTTTLPTGPDKGTQLPADFASPVAATSIPTPTSSTFGFATPSPKTVAATPQPKKSALAELMASLKARGLSLPIILLLLGLGAFLVVIAILFVNYQREMNSSTPPSVMSSTSTTTASPYTQSLEQKINALRTQQTGGVSTGTVTPENPSTFSGFSKPITPVTPVTPTAPTIPGVDAPVTGTMPITEPKPTMMERLEQRGVKPPEVPPQTP
jgi:hypothetical protein